jgi:NADPH:quinone reductase-like Zn-dependent oxidoreductase
MKAIVAQNNKAILKTDRAIPKLRDEYILVKTEAIALNPTDWKHLDYNLVSDGALIGCDFSGTVLEVGKAVTKNWQKGDRVAGVTHGGNGDQLEDGSFAEYIVAKGDLCIRIPDHMNFDQAATFPLGLATVMQGLYHKGLTMDMPDDPVKKKTYVLIYGGSTAAGALGIQFAKL